MEKLNTPRTVVQSAAPLASCLPFASSPSVPFHTNPATSYKMSEIVSPSPVFLRRNVRAVERRRAAAAAATAAAREPEWVSTEWERRIDLDVATNLEAMNTPESAEDLGASVVQQFMRTEIGRSHLEVRLEPIVGSDGGLSTFRVRVSCDGFLRGDVPLRRVGLTVDDMLPYMASAYCLKLWRLMHCDTPLPDKVRRLRDICHAQHDALVARLHI